MWIDSACSACLDFFKSRFPLEKMNVSDLLEHKDVPQHRMSFGYYTGGATLLFLSVQVVTGLMLLYYYQPTVTDAYVSVELISNYVCGGQLIRNIHTWSSSLMILSVIVHLLASFAMKAFEKPRELTWIFGVVLLLITFAFGFTGYLLPWNQIAVNATKVGLESIDSVGQLLPGALSQVPHLLRQTFQGEAAIGQSTLSRFYAIHVVVLPLICLVLLSMHLFSVQLHGMSDGVDGGVKKRERFFPTFLLKDLQLWSVLGFVLCVLASAVPFDAFLPFPLLEPYNALGATPTGIKPEWYFYFIYYPLELLPFWLVMLAGTFVLLLLFLTPWLCRSLSRRTLSFIAVGAAGYLFVITLFGQQICALVRPGG